MQEVDRIAVEDFGLGVLQMMENAGRNLAQLAIRSLPRLTESRVVVCAGSGGNGGGGLCAARHLHNRGVAVSLFLTRPEEELRGPVANQMRILHQAGLKPLHLDQAAENLAETDLVLDALIGYSLSGSPSGAAASLIGWINQFGKRVISLDLPSGLDATSGEVPGVCVRADQTLTLALPKPGLLNPLAGDLYLADIGITPEVFLPLGIQLELFWDSNYILPIRRSVGK